MSKSKTTAAFALAGLVHGVFAAPQAATVTSSVATGSVVPITISTAVPSPSASLGATLPSQAALPPKQDWCPSEIFCAGALLQTVNIAALYADQKTIVDKPTSKGSQAVLSDFSAINNASLTEGGVATFMSTDFKGEGLELEALALDGFNPNPAYIKNITEPVVQAWSQIVHSYWTKLIRGTNETQLCQDGSCESSLIPLNHTFVVPGGRFREQYYWDSFWIVEGLIKSELFDTAKATLENFMDELENFGFIPNGGRIYYLNRSQPPVFINMLSIYVQASGDKDILTRALPLAEKELKWWADNRSLDVKSPYTNQTYSMSRYAVKNSAPRPESYLADYQTAHDPTFKTPLNDSELAALYSNLASGAESGWDYSSRWLKEITPGTTSLASLNVVNTIPVDLNSILYNAHKLLADLYGDANSEAAKPHLDRAASLRAGIIDLFWDSSKYAFYDYNMTSSSRNSLFSMATFYPFWVGIHPDEVLASEQGAFKAFSSINMVMNRYNGTLPTTFIISGLQWDAPNAWPPHQYIALEALRNLPANVTGGALPSPASNQSSFDLIPKGQLGIEEKALPLQTIVSGNAKPTNATGTGPSADVSRVNGTLIANGGVAPSSGNEGWANTLQRELANRYIASAFCSWLSTGGSIPDLVPRYSSSQLNVTQSQNNTGNMFEKFSLVDVGSAGRGGEYTVQAGFGWTNGVVGWIAGTYGAVLAKPVCYDPLWSVNAAAGSGGTKAGNGAMGREVRWMGVALGLVGVMMGLM